MTIKIYEGITLHDIKSSQINVVVISRFSRNKTTSIIAASHIKSTNKLIAVEQTKELEFSC